MAKMEKSEHNISNKLGIGDYMEEIKVVDPEEFLELLNKPIEIQSETIGKLEFRRMLDDDFSFIVNCLKEDIEAEIFCKQFLINQITNPILTIDDLNDMTDTEISHILKKYLKIETIDEFFDFSSHKNIYIIFKEGMSNYREYVASIVNNFKSFLLNNANLLTNAFDYNENLSSYLMDTNEAIISTITAPLKASEAIKQMGTPNKKVSQTIKQLLIPDNHVSNLVNLSAISYASNISEILKKQMEIWQNWMNIDTGFIQASANIALFWDKLEQDYQISKVTAQKYLKKYNWFISPNVDPYMVKDIVTLCENSSEYGIEEINNVFINYFLSKNCEKLDMFLDKWSINPLFNGRIRIIEDCINIIKNSTNENVNYANVVIPTLIAQIDGIQNSFMEIKGLTITKDGIFKANGEILKDELGNVGKKRYFKQLDLNSEFLDFIMNIFLNVLFEDTYHGETCSFTQFNRHKILHGETTDYGKKEHMIRCFMILDFLSELMFIDNNEIN